MINKTDQIYHCDLQTFIYLLRQQPTTAEMTL